MLIDLYIDEYKYMSPRKKLDVKKAIKRPGALSKKASKAHMSVNAFAKKHAKDGNTQTGRQARFYLNTLKPMNDRRKSK